MSPIFIMSPILLKTSVDMWLLHVPYPCATLDMGLGRVPCLSVILFWAALWSIGLFVLLHFLTFVSFVSSVLFVSFVSSVLFFCLVQFGGRG